jgi:uncharacterized protein with von Willebrand factor type A (vWA) domain
VVNLRHRPHRRAIRPHVWLNPESRLYWNYGDSVMTAYERHTTHAFECWTTKHLEGS